MTNDPISGFDPDFDEDNATDSEKAEEWWGNPDVDPYTGRDYDEDGRTYNPEDGNYYDED